MAKLGYNFNKPQHPKHSADQWTRRMRLAILFLAVAAVTVAIICAIIPKKEIPVIEKTPPTEQNQTAEKQEQNSGKPQNDPEKTSENSGITDSGNTTGNTSENAENAEKVPSEKSDSNISQTANSKSSAENTNLPDKGVPTPDDPNPENDTAVRSGNVDSVTEQKLKELFANGDLKNLFIQADQAITGEQPDSAARAAYGKLLTAGRRQEWKSGKWTNSAINYQVKSGDNLSVIARRNYTTVNMLKKSNSLKNSSIMIGQRLNIIPGPWKIQISKKARLLTLCRKKSNRYETFAVFPVGIGRKNSTPAGKFVISHRRFHPVYRDTQGRVFKYGDPQNPLGTVFLALALPDKPDKPYRGYGIHGTADNNTVGRSLSNGCIRMHNDDVTMLFYLLPSGTPVEIIE